MKCWKVSRIRNSYVVYYEFPINCPRLKKKLLSRNFSIFSFSGTDSTWVYVREKCTMAFAVDPNIFTNWHHSERRLSLMDTHDSTASRKPVCIPVHDFFDVKTLMVAFAAGCWRRAPFLMKFLRRLWSLIRTRHVRSEMSAWDQAAVEISGTAASPSWRHFFVFAKCPFYVAYVEFVPEKEKIE